jgi:radical SAM protein with 4Fe4S-binding SPASM domain
MPENTIHTDQDRVHNILKKTWKHYPRFLMNGLSCFLSKPKSFSLPLRVQIENGAGCNLKCRMCALNKMKRKKGFLSFENLIRIYDQINPPYILLTGYTESFLNNDIFKMINYAKSKGSFVSLDSNATIMNKIIIEKLLETKLDSLFVSIDGSNQDIYGKIRKGGILEVVLSNLRELVKQRNIKKSSLKIFSAIIVQKDNIHDLAKLIKLIDSLGVDEITPTPIVEYDIREYEQFTLKNSIPELEKACNEINKLQLNAKLNFEFVSKYLRDYKNNNLEYNKEHCYVPWHSTYITWEGDVLPCCYFYDKQLCFGNVFEQDFRKIWNSKKYREFRKIMTHSRKYRVCQTCRWEEEFIENKFNLIKKVPFLNNLSERKSIK